MNYKQLSEQYQAKFGIAPYEFLPELDFDGIEVRTPREVAIRLIILCLVIEVAFDRMTGKDALNYLADFNLSEYISEKELEYLKLPNKEASIYQTWKVECACIFCWYLGIIKSIPSHQELFDISSVIEYPIKSLRSSPWEFINRKVIVPSHEEIFFYVDLYSRLDYYCDMAKINKLASAANSAVVYERRYALNWLVNFTGETWDNISCDSIY